MKKPIVRKPRVSRAKMETPIDRAFRNNVTNGLGDALFGSVNPPFPYGTQVNQTGTLYINNRWYLVSNFRQLLSEIYVEHGVVQTVVDVPVDDALRGGIEVKTKQLDEAQITDLDAVMEQENDLGKMAQALKWNRLFGGAAVICFSGMNPDAPLNIHQLKQDQPIKFRAVDMWELFFTQMNTSDYSAAIDAEILDESTRKFSYYDWQVDRSRCLMMKGIEAPSFIRPRLRGWGLSICETLVNSINQYLKANNLIFEVLDEFKVDVYKIKNLTNSLLSKVGTQKIRERVALANQQKNFQSAITMDSEDDFIQKELSFTGVAETMTGIRMQIASDLRMPLTKVFGISAQGFNSGEDDIENYNAMVESQVREKCKYHILKMIEIRCQQLFGYIPDDLTIEFQPLRILSSEQQENVKTQKFTRLLQAAQAGLITSKEFREGVNKADLMPIQLDPNADVLDLTQDDGEEEGAGDGGAAPPKSQLDAKDSKEAKQ